MLKRAMFKDLHSRRTERAKDTPGRIILARDGFPYLGGSSTILYLLFESLVQRLPNAECWNIVSPRVWHTARRHFGPHWSNPKALPNVRTFVVDGQDGHKALRYAMRIQPTAGIISKSRRTTPLLKRLAGRIPVWHLTSTCSVIKNAVSADRLPSMERAIKMFSQKSDLPVLRCHEELQAVRLADKILFHTKSMKFWYYTFYPQYQEKMEDEIFWDYPLLKRQFHMPRQSRQSWEKRPIDLMFVASDWKRPEKNFPMLKRLCEIFRSKKIMVVGFRPSRLPSSVITFDSMSQPDVLQAMVQSKVIVSPSRYDEAPNVLFEAAIAGANIVCSKNCGNYRLTPKELLARLEVPDFIDKIKLALQESRPANNTDYFGKHDLTRWILKQVNRNNGR